MFFWEKKKNSNAPTMSVAHLKLNGLHCVSCSLNIDGTVEDLPGVKSSSTSYAKGESRVEFDPNTISEESIKAAIEQLGYKVS
jgi:copper chaperone CopZ